LELLRRVSNSADPDEDQAALRTIRRFIRDRTVRRRFWTASSSGRHHTRIFCGQKRLPLAEWLGDLRLYTDWNLEIISPYFDPHGAGPLVDLVDTLDPRETRVFLPRDIDGTAQVTAKTFKAIEEFAYWADLAPEITSRGRDDTSAKLPPRRVHAKVYRLWSRDGGDILLIGSPNLTEAAHSRADAGNLEAAFLVDVSDLGFPRKWWLVRNDDEPETFADTTHKEEDGLQPAALDLSLRFDWASGELSYRLIDPAPGGFEICDTTGGSLFRVPQPRRGKWIPCATEASGKVEDILPSTSFLLIKHAKGSWRVLVREENMAHRPSLLTQLTTEEILEYWSLLTPEQRAVFIERRIGMDATDQGIPLYDPEKLVSRHTIFDHFAGIYHAFGCLRRYASQAIEEGRERAAEARLLGAKYDSLPCLLEKSLEHEEEDPILRYVTFLCARQTRDLLAKEHPAFFRERKKQAERLNTLLDSLSEVRSELPIAEIEGGQQFIDWYEDAFLKPVTVEENER
jgi:hypothetical protein